MSGIISTIGSNQAKTAVFAALAIAAVAAAASVFGGKKVGSIIQHNRVMRHRQWYYFADISSFYNDRKENS
jgi:hypothetical protein